MSTKAEGSLAGAQGAKQDDGRPKFVDARTRPRLPSMLITSDFLFLHVPRTGGRFLRRLCHEHLPPERMIRNALGPHTDYHVVAHDFADLPMIAFVRNPWDWYVSWYHHMIETDRGQRRGPIWRAVLGDGRHSFRRAVGIACSGTGMEDVARRDVMCERATDYYSATFWLRAGQGVDEGRVEVGRYEHLGDDFIAFLKRHGVKVPEGLARGFEVGPRVGATDRGDYRDYYDDALRDLVAEKARDLIAAYGYTFD